MKDKSILKKSLIVLCVLAGAGLAFGTVKYLDYKQRLVVLEHNRDLTDMLMETAQCNLLLHQLNNAQADQAKESLNSRLVSNLAEIDSLALEADMDQKKVATTFVNLVRRDQKTHPEYYLAAYWRTSASKTEVMQASRH